MTHKQERVMKAARAAAWCMTGAAATAAALLLAMAESTAETWTAVQAIAAAGGIGGIASMLGRDDISNAIFNDEDEDK